MGTTEAAEIFLATGNAHKVGEMQSLADASRLAVRLRSAKEAGGMPHVPEDTGTFVGNAGQKARTLHAKLGGRVWVMSDDSGICVDALGGAPGVESANYAGPAAAPAANVAKLLAALAGVPEGKRTAHFVSVLCVIAPDGTEQIFEGRCDGRVIEALRGDGGFGYDPIIIPDGYDRTFAELGDDVKNRLSHRAQAFGKFAEWWRGRRRVGPSGL